MLKRMHKIVLGFLLKKMLTSFLLTKAFAKHSIFCRHPDLCKNCSWWCAIQTINSAILNKNLRMCRDFVFAFLIRTNLIVGFPDICTPTFKILKFFETNLWQVLKLEKFLEKCRSKMVLNVSHNYNFECF